MASDSDSPRGAAVSSSPAADLRHTVDEMTRLVQELRRTQSIIRLRTILGTLLLIVVMVAFGLMTYQKMRENLAQEKLQQATADRVKLLIPQLEAPIRATLNNVVPFYMEMGRERLRAMGPKMDARIKDQSDRLGAELERRINAQVEASFGRIMNRTMVELSREFPVVAQDGGVRSTERLKQAMAGETGRLVEHGRTLYDTQSRESASPSSGSRCLMCVRTTPKRSSGSFCIAS